MDFGRVITAMLTPMQADGSVNFDEAQRLAAYLLENGSDALLVAGTTGESPTLRPEEKLKLFAAVGEVCHGAGRPFLAGTGSYDTAATVELSKKAEAMGADGLLVVTPQYNRPPQEGLYRHFCAVAEAVQLPIVVYNVPSRTGVNLEADTVERLSQVPNIFALKEASGNLDQMSKILRCVPKDFYVYCGDDYLTLPALSLGASGVISVVAHVIGPEMQELVTAFENGDHATAAELHLRNYPVYKALFARTNPMPVKYAMSRLGFQTGPLRLPLVELDDEGKQIVDAVLKELGKL